MRAQMVMVAALVATACATTALAERDVKKLPGYVDFDREEVLGDLKPTVEVNLSESILKFMAGAASSADPQIADSLNGIVDMRIKVFELERPDAERLAPKVEDLVEWLDENSWSRIVHVQEESESVNIYIRTDGDNMAGLALVVSGPDELVFINIVGNIDPERMGSLIGMMSGNGEVDLDFEFLNRVDATPTPEERASTE